MITKQYKEKVSVDVISIYFAEVNKYPELDPEAERDLVNKARTNNDDRGKLLKYNLWVVPSVARKFAGSSLSFIDLICEGNFGLLKAIAHLEDYKGESKFSTFVYRCVSRSILDALRKERKAQKVSLEALTQNDSSTSGNILESKVEKPDVILEKKDLIETAKAVLKNLTPKTQEIFKKRFEEDKNMREIADELEFKSHVSAYNHLKKGLAILKSRFAEAS